jgi:hypothetical protein
MMGFRLLLGVTGVRSLRRAGAALLKRPDEPALALDGRDFLTRPAGMSAGD